MPGPGLYGALVPQIPLHSGLEAHSAAIASLQAQAHALQAKSGAGSVSAPAVDEMRSLFAQFHLELRSHILILRETMQTELQKHGDTLIDRLTIGEAGRDPGRQSSESHVSLKALPLPPAGGLLAQAPSAQASPLAASIAKRKEEQRQVELELAAAAEEAKSSDLHYGATDRYPSEQSGGKPFAEINMSDMVSGMHLFNDPLDVATAQSHGSYAPVQSSMSSASNDGARISAGKLNPLAESAFEDDKTEACQSEPLPSEAAGSVSAMVEVFVTSGYFESAVAVAIFINSALVGVQAHALVTSDIGLGMSHFLDALEVIFTVIFVVEYVLRLKVYGCAAFRPDSCEGRTNLAEALLVITTSILFTWVLPLIFSEAGLEIEVIESLQLLLVFRMLRLVRVIHAFSDMPFFREAWLLMSGLGHALPTLFWSCSVIFAITYMFAIVGIIILVRPLQTERGGSMDPVDIDRLDMLMPFVAGLDNFMVTLIQALTQDSFHTFMRDIGHFRPWSWIFFYAYIGVAYLILMNLVTGLLVEKILSMSGAATQGPGSCNPQEFKDLQSLVLAADVDHSGFLSSEKFRKSFEDPALNKKWMLLNFHASDCAELFDILDEGDGEVPTEQFLTGLTRMKGVAQAKDVLMLLHRLSRLHHAFARAFPERRSLQVSCS